MKRIHLPCLRGNYGDWSYFSTIMRISDIVDGKRIITVAESKALYTLNINQILQREVDRSRISKIKEYLKQNQERFFSSIIVAIHKGNPEWADFDIERQFKIDNELIEDNEVEFIENKLGVLTLSGSEEIFVLDGQHRLLGLRAAYQENEKLGEDEQSIILVVHKKELKERTRRLFTVLNRYAVSIKPAEKVILEEDDAAAILTRRLVQQDKIFLLDNALSDTKAFSLPPTDTMSFTTLVCLYEISKVLINYNELYKSKLIKRPTDEKLDDMFKSIIDFWSFFFEAFPDVVRFIKGQSVSENFKRNKVTGGSLLLRPEGQLLIASTFQHFKNKGRLNDFKKLITKVDYALNGKTWNYIFWKGNSMESKNKKLKSSVLHYLLGDDKEKPYVERELKELYKKYNVSYRGHIKPLVANKNKKQASVKKTRAKR